MSMYDQKILNLAFVAKDQSTWLSPSAGTKVTRTNLPEGTLAIVDMENKAKTSLPSSGFFKFAYKGPNNDIIFSAPIDVANITVTTRKFIADAEQVTIIGYQGSGSDNVPAVNSTAYTVSLQKVEASKARRGVGYDIDWAAGFTTSASSSAKEWAFFAADGLLSSQKQEVNENWLYNAYAKIQVIGNGTMGSTSGTNLGSATATYGSKWITLAADVTGMAAGSIINIGNSATAGDIYEVETINHTTLAVSLTKEFRGATASGIATAVYTTAPTLYGVKITGLVNGYDVYRNRDYYKNNFKVRVLRGSEPDTTKVATTVAPTVGSGNFPQVAEAEFVSYGELGRNRMITDMPPLRRPTLADSAKLYSLVELSVKNTSTPTLVGGLGVFNAQYMLWLELDSNKQLASGSQGDKIATAIVSGFTTGDLNA
jgi:hypothetical protein